MSEGAKRIATERARQVSEEGYESEHDEGHFNQELAWAASCYIAPDQIFVQNQYSPREERLACETDGRIAIVYHDPWPWQEEHDKRPGAFPDEADIDQRIRALEKGGALCAAEIDRLLALKAKHEEAHREAEDRMREAAERAGLPLEGGDS